MGYAYNTQLQEFDDIDFESDDDMLDLDLEFEADIDLYLNRQDALVEALRANSSQRSNKKSKSKNKSSTKHLPQDWQDFDYGEDEGFIDG